MKPKIIFTTPVLGYPPVGGPRLRIDNSIKALVRISDLIIYSRVSKEGIGGDKALEHFESLSSQFIFSPSVNPDYKKRINKRLIRFVDFFDLVKLAKREKVKIIWLGYGNISYGLAILLSIFTQLKVVIDTDSVWSRFVFRSLPHIKSPKLKHKKRLAGIKKVIQEYLGTKLADMTTAVSEYDAKYYKKLSKNKVTVFSNVIDLDSYKEKPTNYDIKTPSVYLAGSYGPDSPMEESAIWIIQKVLPLVWPEIPNLHFYVVGRSPTDKMYQLQNNNITITGEVPSVLPYLCNVDIVLVPLKYESGTRFKILETAVIGVPIVSTTLGAEGIPVKHKEDIMIADNAEDFAKSIIKLINDKDLSQTLTKNAYQNIALEYGIDRAEKEASIIIEKLIE
jgi:polysaccharide biosynthesis protein PslH